MSLTVSVVISDPWDLGEALGWPHMRGELVRLADDDQGGRALIRLETPVERDGVVYRFVVAAPRHHGDEIEKVRAGKCIVCALTGISDQQAESDNALDTSDWRGGLAFIGAVDRMR